MNSRVCVPLDRGMLTSVRLPASGDPQVYMVYRTLLIDIRLLGAGYNHKVVGRNEPNTNRWIELRLAFKPEGKKHSYHFALAFLGISS